jgi:hypothetical protein
MIKSADSTTVDHRRLEKRIALQVETGITLRHGRKCEIEPRVAKTIRCHRTVAGQSKLQSDPSNPARCKRAKGEPSPPYRVRRMLKDVCAGIPWRAIRRSKRES